MSGQEILTKFKSYTDKVKKCVKSECEITPQDIENIEKYIAINIDKFKYYQRIEYIKNDIKSITLLTYYRPASRIRVSERILIIYKLHQPKHSTTLFKPILDRISSYFNNNYNKQEVLHLLNLNKQIIFSSYDNYEILDNKYLLIIYPQQSIEYSFLNQQSLPSSNISLEQQQSLNSLSIDFRILHTNETIERLKDCKGLIELIVFDKQTQYLDLQIQILKNLLNNNQETLSRISLTLPYEDIQIKDIQEIGQLIFKSRNITHFEIGQQYEFKYQKIEQYPQKVQKSFKYFQSGQNKSINLFEKVNNCFNLKYLSLQLQNTNFEFDRIVLLCQNILKFPNLYYFNLSLSSEYISEDIAILLADTLVKLKNLRCFYLLFENFKYNLNWFKSFLKGLFKCDYLSTLEIQLRRKNNKYQNNQLKLQIYKNMKRLVNFSNI